MSWAIFTTPTCDAAPVWDAWGWRACACTSFSALSLLLRSAATASLHLPCLPPYCRYSTLAARCLEEDPKARPPISEVIAQLTCMLEARDAGYESLEAPGSIPTGASLEGAAGGAAAASGSQNAAGNGSQAGPVYCEAGAGWQGVAEGPSGRQLGPGSGGQAGGGQCTGGSTAGMQPAVEQHAGQQPVEHPALVEQATGWSGRQAGVGAQAASVPAAATSAARPESAVSVPSLVRLQALVADADTTPGQGS